MADKKNAQVLTGEQLSFAVLPLSGSIVASGGKIDTTCLVDTENGQQLAYKVFNMNGGGQPIMNKVVRTVSTMPTATAETLGQVNMFIGESTSDYKNGYIYEGSSVPANTASVTFYPNTIDCSGSDFWDFWKSPEGAPNNYTEIVKGEMLLVGGNTWKLIGRNNNDEIVKTYQQYDEDWVALGFTFSGTFEEGDSVSFKCAINETGSTVYWWERLDVQPANKGASTGMAVDSELSSTSIHPVQNKVIYEALQNIWTKDNLKAGDNISITQIPKPIIDEHTLGLFHCDGNANNEITGSEAGSFAFSTFQASPAKWGQSAYLGGNAYNILVPYIPGETKTYTTLTLEFWYYRENAIGHSNKLINIGNPQNYPLFTMASDGGNLYFGGDPISVPLQTWHHIAFTIQPQGQQLKAILFVDGTKYDKNVLINTSSLNMSNFNGQISLASDFCDTYFDEIRFSNKVEFTEDFTPFTKPYTSVPSDPEYQINAVGLQKDITWEKPVDWVDIRSGALPNSVYYLVGHKADYSAYPIFDVTFEIESSGTYDVYVDGIKKLSAIASGSEAELNWQTLALTSGFDVTYPQALRTHVVRVTPTDSTKKITHIVTGHIASSAVTNKFGCLWAHVTLDYACSYSNGFGYSQYNAGNLLEAITAKDGVIKVNNMVRMIAGNDNLKTLPILDGDGISPFPSFSYFSYELRNAPLQKIHFRNIKQNLTSNNADMFTKHYNLEEVVCENCQIAFHGNLFRTTSGNYLKKIPESFVLNPEDGSAFNLWNNTGNNKLEPTFLDLSSKTVLTKLSANGTSDNKTDGLKGLVVSNQAPFSGTSPQINVSYTGLDRAALINLFNSLPTVTDSQVCDVTGCTGASDLTTQDLAIATSKGWTITR